MFGNSPPSSPSPPSSSSSSSFLASSLLPLSPLPFTVQPNNAPSSPASPSSFQPAATSQVGFSQAQVQALSAQLLSAAPLVPPKLFPGKTTKENEGAIDWGPQQLIAFGSHSYVVVAEPNSLRIIQTLDEHRAPVAAVRWSLDPLSFNSEDSPYRLQLASADTSGVVILWNVLEASITATYSDSRPVIDLLWHPEQPGLLLILYATGITLWDAAQNQKRWKKDFPQDQFDSFALNPFDSTQLGLSSTNGNIYFIRDLNQEVPPTQFELKYRITTIRPPPPSPSKPKDSKQPAKPPKPDFKQMIFSPCYRNILFFVLSREILIYDLTINQVVSSIGLERGRSPFASVVLSRWKPRWLFAVHENNSFSSWKKDRESLYYDVQCFSELSRFNKQSRKPPPSLTAFTNNSAVREAQFAVVGNDGALWLWKFLGGSRAKFSISGVIEGASSIVASMAVNPFPKELETPEPTDGKKVSTIVALGTFYGTVQLVDIASSVVISEFVVSQHVVRAVRWLSPTLLLAFSVEEVDKNAPTFKNFLSVVDLRSGRSKEIRKINGCEATCIRGIYVSAAFQYFIVVLKDRPLEIWDAKSLTMLRTVKIGVKTSALSWAPLNEPSPILLPSSSTLQKAAREQFIVATLDSELYLFTVEGNNFMSNQLQIDLGSGIISSLAWKDGALVGGDIGGMIICWSFEQRKARLIQTGKGVVRRIRFSPTEHSHNVLVMFSEGDFGIWDVNHGVRISNSGYLRERELRAVEVDWLDVSPIVATSDGAIRLLDRSLSITNSSFNLSTWTEPLFTPYLLPPKEAMSLKVKLQHSLLDDIASRKLSASFLDDYHRARGTIPDRCLAVARYFGELQEIRFWILVRHAFSRLGQKRAETEYQPSAVFSGEKAQVAVPQITPAPVDGDNRTDSAELPLFFDLLLESESIKSIERGRSATHAQAQKSRASYELQQKSVESCVLQGNKLNAIDLLLQTSPDNPQFYKDALKACVVAASYSQETFYSTMQRVASSLISNGKLDEGVQLLCLIDKADEACHYLQDSNRWLEAAWLAKVALKSSDECESVLRRWAEHLAQTDQKSRAAEVYVTLGDFHQVLQLLHETQRFDLGALFVSACREISILTTEPEGQVRFLSVGSFEENSDHAANNGRRLLIPLETLLQSIHLDYGFLLHRLEIDSVAGLYWQKAGQAGQAMIETLKNTVATPSRKHRSRSSSHLHPGPVPQPSISTGSLALNSDPEERD